MKTAFLISTEKQNLAQTIVSLEENSIKPDKYILLINSSSLLDNKNIIKSLTGNCCGNTAVSKEHQGYEVNTKNNFTSVEKNIVSFADLMNYTNVNELQDIDIIFTATSGTIFNNKYIEKTLEKFKDDSIGVVYSDYIANKIPNHLQYVQPMLSSPIKIKEFAVRRSLMLNSQFNINYFELIMSLFNASIIRHIPEELFAT